MDFYNNIWPFPQSFDIGEMFTPPENFSIAGDAAEIIKEELNNSQLGKRIKDNCDFKIIFRLTEDYSLASEGYRLKNKKRGNRSLLYPV